MRRRTNTATVTPAVVATVSLGDGSECDEGRGDVGSTEESDLSLVGDGSGCDDDGDSGSSEGGRKMGTDCYWIADVPLTDWL